MIRILPEIVPYTTRKNTVYPNPCISRRPKYQRSIQVLVPPELQPVIGDFNTCRTRKRMMSEPSSQPSSQQRSDLGSDAGSELGSELGSEFCSDAESGITERSVM